VVAFLHGGSPFKVWQPDSFRIRLNRRSTFNYSRDILEIHAKSNCVGLVGVRGFGGITCIQPGENDARSDAFLYVGLEGRSIPGRAPEIAGRTA
jgi:hypothetical protein